MVVFRYNGGKRVEHLLYIADLRQVAVSLIIVDAVADDEFIGYGRT